MEFPKEVVCIDDDWKGWDVKLNVPAPKKDQVYIATAINKHSSYSSGYGYILKEFPGIGYSIQHFADLNSINISEVTQILKEEPCTI